MRAKLQLKGLKLNKEKYLKTLNDQLDVAVRQAARAWLKAVLTRVPSYTGMARGSLLPLGQFLHVAVPTSLSPNAKAHGHKSRVAEGQSLGHFKFEHLKTVVNFIFETEVLHFILNDKFDMNPPIHLTHLPRPWDSMTVGKEAFFAFLKEDLPNRIPKLGSYVESFDLKD